MKRVFHFIIVACILAFIPAYGMEARLQVSLITCWPGPEVYELCGHEAIRIRGIDEKGAAMDSVWNYGVFDFNAPNFVYRFVKGETDYMLEAYPFKWFLPQYMMRGSKVLEQDLNLTPAETATLRRLLQVNALPQHRVYRYNYVRDNCSTRVADMIGNAVAPLKISYPDSVSFPSFRNAMRFYHRNYPWYQFGIDLALGSGIDLPISSRDELFSPILLEEKMGSARLSDGRPLVKTTTTLVEGREGAVLPPTPWWRTPLFASLLALLLSIIAFIDMLRTSSIRKCEKIWMCVFFSLLGLAGCVVWFLVFISTHDSTSPNLLFLWANPLQLVIAACLWWRHTRPAAAAMAVCNLVVLIILICAWPLQNQVANPSIFPLWGATLMLSAAYAIIYPRLSYKHRPSPKTRKGASRRRSASSSRYSRKK